MFYHSFTLLVNSIQKMKGMVNNDHEKKMHNMRLCVCAGVGGGLHKPHPF